MAPHASSGPIRQSGPAPGVMAVSCEGIAVASGPLGPPAEPDRPAPILVVEDDPRLRRLIRRVLELAGFAVETAADGWQALALASHRRPAAVVLDLKLPRLDGEDVADGLEMLYEAGVPIVVVSGAPDVAEQAQRLGATAWLRKPFASSELVAVLRRVVAGG